MRKKAQNRDLHAAKMGKLDIRPPYQREFIYKDKQRDAVIDSVRKDFPLNVMCWAVRKGGDYEVLDGQQRTLSICQYVNGDFSINGLAYHNLKDNQLPDAVQGRQSPEVGEVKQATCPLLNRLGRGRNSIRTSAPAMRRPRISTR